jgi:hypothetical protein
LGTHDAVSHLLLALAEGVADSLLVVIKLRRELAANGSKPFEIVSVWLC